MPLNGNSTVGLGENEVLFDPGKHIRNVFTRPECFLHSSDGTVLEGIRGTSGAAEIIGPGISVGADRIKMESGAEFELHTHPGAHILYVLSSRGYIHVDGVDYEMAAGDTVYVPADYPHGVKTDPAVDQPLELLAFGVPHMPIDSTKRMTVVRPPMAAEQA
ncbi:cupin domain-containing protein [Nonomuraea sp. B12E4]|uniref:cupin domain-containing protein n=1 Tax=Nonomuraea sp. B12E4 TaxID=3153564 RepID=UPI00325D865D